MPIAINSLLESTSDVCGGRIRIGGSRITVGQIANLYRQGRSAEDIAHEYSHLSLSQVYAALAYFHANRSEIEAELAHEDAEYDRLKGLLNKETEK